MSDLVLNRKKLNVAEGASYYSHSYYLYEMMTNPEYVLDRAVNTLRDVEFDTLVGTGLSGCVLILPLALRLEKRWAIVRKDGDSTHRATDIEGSIGKRWVFFDDLVASGATRARVINAVNKAHREEWDCNLGLYGGYRQIPVSENTELVGQYTFEDNLFSYRDGEGWTQKSW